MQDFLHSCERGRNSEKVSIPGLPWLFLLLPSENQGYRGRWEASELPEENWDYDHIHHQSSVFIKLLQGDALTGASVFVQTSIL